MFASDLSQEENGNDDWKREFQEKNQERKNQEGRRKDRPELKEKEERKGRRDSLKTKADCDDGDRSKPRVRVRSAPQSRKFAPTVPEPFGMTVREEERRKAQELALAIVKPAEEKKQGAGQEEQFKAIPMPDHIKDETRCVRAKSFQLFYRDQVPTDHGEKRREESQGKRVGKGEDC